MREYKKKGKKYREYTFEEWQKYFQPGQDICKNPSYFKSDDTYLIFPEEVWAKIEWERKRIYNEQVEHFFELEKEKFEKQYRRSKSKERLLDKEIESFETLLFPEKLPLFKRGVTIVSAGIIPRFPNFSQITIRDIRGLYDKIIVRGQSTYCFSGSLPYYHHLAEAYSNYYEWLKERKKHHLQIQKATEKLEIASKIIGSCKDNPSNTKQPVFHHIPDVLEELNLTYLEAINILLDIKGAFSPKQNENVIDKIIIYLKSKSEVNRQIERKSESTVLPSLHTRMISFDNSETKQRVIEVLEGYFSDNIDNLKIALDGSRLDNPILFPHNQNKFVEVFRRLKYNNLIPNKSTEICDWICINFCFRYKRGDHEEVKPFNKSTVWDILSKGKGEPAKKERICVADWLPYRSPSQLKSEIQKENIKKNHTPY